MNLSLHNLFLLLLRISLQSYSTLAWIPEMSGSWALPLKHERITSFETPVSKAAFQLKQVTEQLCIRPLTEKAPVQPDPIAI
jgi:hypothetical protein